MAIEARKHDGRPAVNLEIVLGPCDARVPVQMTLDAHGLTVRRKGRRRALYADWDRLLSRMAPDGQAAAKYISNPVGLLVDG